MIVLGLTGSIGMGKSTASAFFRALGVPVYDADASVHAVYAKGGAAVGPIGASFPDAIVDGAVDRTVLKRHAEADQAVYATLEKIVHPIVRRVQMRFLQTMALNGAPLVVLDIPLLFETGGQDRCDGVVVVSAPAFIQRQRVMARPGMTETAFAAILARQTPDAEKRARADFVVPSNRGMRDSFLRIRRIRDAVRLWRPHAWPYNPNMVRPRRTRALSLNRRRFDQTG
jgi:dephospho-CoA kinase